MTSTPIKDAMTAMPGMGMGTASAGKSVTETKGQEFQSALQKAKAPEQNTQSRMSVKPAEKSSEAAGAKDAAKKADKPEQKKEDAKAENSEKAEQSGESKKETRAEKAEKKTETKETETSEKPMDGTTAEEQEKISEAAGMMMQSIAEIMNVSPETVQQMAEQLGLSEADLLTPDGLRQLAIGLTEGADQMSLLTDENLYGQVSELFSALQEVTEESGLQISFADVAAAKQLAELPSQAAEPENAVEDIRAEQAGWTAAAQTEATDEAGSSSSTDSVQDAQQMMQSRTGSNLAAEQVVVEKTAEKPDFAAQDERGQIADADFSQIAAPQSPGGENFGTQQIFAEMEELANAALPDTQEIMDQIVDYMKVSLKPEMTNLEMQLHPQSLGMLHIQISSKEGLMTAQFTTQSEEVRAVLESQMLDLRQNLEDQGIKVEAVEVTVAEYNLDRDPGQGTQQDAQQRDAERSTGKAQRRALTLEDLREEDLTPEEKLTAEVMRESGSTVNYQA